MMDWFPIVFMTFKLIVLGIGMFYAIKWHYDQGKKGKRRDTRALLRAGGTVVTLCALTLLGLGVATMVLVRMLGLDLTL